jgi:hypothetical protein
MGVADYRTMIAPHLQKDVSAKTEAIGRDSLLMPPAAAERYPRREDDHCPGSMSGAVATVRRDAEDRRTEATGPTPPTREGQMMAILHTELVYSTATVTLLALTATLTLNRFMPRFAPARRRQQRSGGAMNQPRRPILRCD